MSTAIKTREQLVDELPEELLLAAKAELEGQEWFEALPRNANEDEAVFTRALEMQEELRLQSAMTATDHLATLAEQMDARTEEILNTLSGNLDQAVTDAVENLDLRAVRDSQIPLVQAIDKAA